MGIFYLLIFRRMFFSLGMSSSFLIRFQILCFLKIFHSQLMLPSFSLCWSERVLAACFDSVRDCTKLYI